MPASERREARQAAIVPAPTGAVAEIVLRQAGDKIELVELR